MGKYDRQIAQAQRKITSKGGIVTWRKIPRAADPNQPWKTTNPAPATQDFQTSVVFLRKGSASSLLRLMKATDVTEGAPDALLAGGQAFTPEITDIIINASNQKFVISGIDIVMPDGTPILYLLRFE